ncbi:acetyl-CoA hydrolase/transferase C-terminal domain-containing protein [uncultured Salinisphaera sp.]|uniref:acetyl-CoA hydrolase/transferase C-terminal domain-containing protein n=1 Tax=uncultured Salinisphaera sp. TaxID=359372 RepID=UPI0032B116CF
MSDRPQRFTDAEATIDWLLDTVGHDIHVGAPLGLGKPATLLNALYARAKANPEINLKILTALSLDVPQAGSELERRIMDPIVERVFEDYPGLDYVRDLNAGTVPDNITISEFFFQPGAMLGNDDAQRHYRSVNYTHVARDLINAGVNVLMQMGAPGPDDSQFSLSSNTDVTLDLMPVVEAMRERGEPIWVVGQLNARMPMMTRSALVDAAMADAVFEGEAATFKPFGAPAMPVAEADYAIGLRVSSLLEDGGTLQIGIGSLSDAIAYCCDLRHNHNADYRALLDRLNRSASERTLADAIGGEDVFERGLYGCTEMLVDAYIQMYRSDVISRPVYDDIDIQRLLDAGTIGEWVGADTLAALRDSGAIRAQLDGDDVARLKQVGVFKAGVTYDNRTLDAGDGGEPIAADLDDDTARSQIVSRCLGDRLKGATLVHGGFFLGPNSFYQALRDLDDDERELFHMTSVGQINELYGNEALRRVQRRGSRFVNTAIKATLAGAIASDGLENGQVISGVGGQYNFVSQAHALEGARSIICVRAVRQSSDGPESNVVSHYAHTTIPRHLRDIVVTEYGAADLRGKTDEQVAMAMIEIADARFQDELRSAAVSAGKLRRDYQVPAHARNNTPDNLRRLFAPEKAEGRFEAYPYGSDFTEIERTLIAALKKLQGGSHGKTLSSFARHAARLATLPASAEPYLERMGLQRPRGLRESLYARVVALALINDGVIDSDDEPGHDAVDS